MGWHLKVRPINVINTVHNPNNTKRGTNRRESEEALREREREKEKKTTTSQMN